MSRINWLMWLNLATSIGAGLTLLAAVLTLLFAPWEASAPLALSGHPLPQVAAQLPAPLNPRPERPNWRPAA